MNYLVKLSPVTADVFEPLRKLTPSKSKQTWNSTYQYLYDRAKAIIKKMQPWNSIMRKNGSTQNKSYTSEGWNVVPQK